MFNIGKPSRRDFIGSILGTLALSKINWIAEAVAAEPKRNTLYERYERFLSLPGDKLYDFRILNDTIEGGTIFAPGIKSIKKNEFQAESIDIIREFSSIGCKIVDDEGYILGQGTYNTHILTSYGDKLYVTYTIPTREEISLAIKQDSFTLSGKVITPQTKAIRVYS